MSAQKKTQPTNISQHQTNKPVEVQPAKSQTTEPSSQESGMMSEPQDSRQPSSRSDIEQDPRRS